MAAVWTDIADGDIDPESPITTGLMTALRDRTEGLAAGVSGAPKIVQGALDAAVQAQFVSGGNGHNHSGGDGASIPGSSIIADNTFNQSHLGANCVGQSELKVSGASQSVAIGGNLYGSIDPAGSTYTTGWFAGADTATPNIDIKPHATTYAARVNFYNNAAGSQTAYLYSLYVPASPPWNLGNGDIPLFVLVKTNEQGDILGTYVAPDPFWAYHGPHDLHPINGKLLRAAGLWGASKRQILAGLGTIGRDEYMTRLQGLKLIKEDPALFRQALSYQFTMDEKNVDMNICPHGFNLEPGERVIMLDPVGSFMEGLLMHHDLLGEDDQDESIPRLIEAGLIEIRTTINANTPNGVIAVSARWRNTGA